MMQPVTLYVTYQGSPDSRFDRRYYADSHLPLVMEAFAPYGLLKLSVFYPETRQPGTLAICECIFRDDAAINDAFTSHEVERVMADVSHFTDISPVRLRGTPL
ncbi:EthD family reductase [Pantoea dispersa]|uniref:EthD family reductase n=1 Tax=Pantoea dispersa TaxID=59814 RepID=UPI0024B63A18|nr:EthD family reductase [Pantoea dispersa]MDI9769480.1 EthD family reductase [Pantoea dispersa]